MRDTERRHWASYRTDNVVHQPSLDRCFHTRSLGRHLSSQTGASISKSWNKADDRGRGAGRRGGGIAWQNYQAADQAEIPGRSATEADVGAVMAL